MASGYRKLKSFREPPGVYDQPRYEGPGAARYLVCSTQRSGSNLLCRQLFNAGLGVPLEYFNRGPARQTAASWNLAEPVEFAKYAEECLARRTTPNGVWGSKLQWPQYGNVRRAFDEFLPRISHFIFLYRRDLVGQGISLHISQVTGVWQFDGVQGTERIKGVALGDARHASRCISQLVLENAEWREFFAGRKVTPLVLCYEDYAVDQPGGMRRIAEFLGVAPGSYAVPPAEPRENALGAEIEDARKRLASRLDPARWEL